MIQANLAIIGGSGFYHPTMLSEIKDVTAHTPYGDIKAKVGKLGNNTVVFLPRHGSDHSVLPHQLNYRANIWGLKELGVQRIIATSAVGSLRKELPPGTLALVDQFLDFTKQRALTYFDKADAHKAHVDFTEPYCPEIRSILKKSATKLGYEVYPRACYVCVEGPRYETSAEVRMFQTLGGDVVGMTGVPEVVFARELGLCYANVSVVTNWAAGIHPAALTHTEVVEIMAQNQEKLRQLIVECIGNLHVPTCNCHRE